MLSGLLLSPTVQECRPTVGQRVVDLMNRHRAATGIAPLVVDLRLAEAAQRHSDDMARGRFLAHEGSDGSSVARRVGDAGYDWRAVSENIAAGQGSPDSVVAAWLRSPGHRANLLDGSMRHVGVGYAVADNDRYAHYWTADFGATSEPPRTQLDGCHP
jgi:uncharacterized protein YkwD